MAQNRKNIRGSSPDGEDVRACLDAIWNDHSVSAEVHLYVDLTNRLIMEVVGQGYSVELGSVNESVFEPWQPLNGTMDAALMRLLHQMWHLLDRKKLGPNRRS